MMGVGYDYGGSEGVVALVEGALCVCVEGLEDGECETMYSVNDLRLLSLKFCI
jgi:hypothetical protein